MPEINIVRIDEIAECVNKTLEGIRDGLLQARANGILAKWPEKVDFQMTVVKDWQALDIASGEKSTTTEVQGGFQTETTTSGGTNRETGSEKRTTTGRNSHIENDGTTTTSSEA